MRRPGVRPSSAPPITHNPPTLTIRAAREPIFPSGQNMARNNWNRWYYTAKNGNEWQKRKTQMARNLVIHNDLNVLCVVRRAGLLTPRQNIYDWARGVSHFAELA